MFRIALLYIMLWPGTLPASGSAVGTAISSAAPAEHDRQQGPDAFGAFQDSLLRLGMDMYRKQAEPERLAANYAFIKTLVGALRLPHSFDFGFDSLKMISIQESPDRVLRIFSWPIRLSDGSYRYYGTIQLRTDDGSLKLFPLLDKTYEIPNPEQAIIPADEWYGAQYYDIIPHAGSYLLLGWKGHNPRLTHKVIDVLTIDRDRDRALFGKAIFDAPDYRDHTRMIFRFAAGLSMHLTFQKDANRIIFDHLVPPESRYLGQFEYYGPDLTFDAWILEREKLHLVEEAEYQ